MKSTIEVGQDQMFNEHPIEYMRSLGERPPERKCYCGWYPLGECPNCDGPWEVDDLGIHLYVSGARPEIVANAALIAAAPELYEALERLMRVQAPKDNEPSMANEILDQATAALKKARGE